MLISEPMYAAAYQAPGADAAGVRRHRMPARRGRGANERRAHAIWFHDAADGRWIDGVEAVVRRIAVDSHADGRRHDRLSRSGRRRTLRPHGITAASSDRLGDLLRRRVDRDLRHARFASEPRWRPRASSPEHAAAALEMTMGRRSIRRGCVSTRSAPRMEGDLQRAEHPQSLHRHAADRGAGVRDGDVPDRHRAARRVVPARAGAHVAAPRSPWPRPR